MQIFVDYAANRVGHVDDFKARAVNHDIFGNFVIEIKCALHINEIVLVDCAAVHCIFRNIKNFILRQNVFFFSCRLQSDKLDDS